MTATFLILAAITIAGTAAAMTLRNPIHCILALTVGLAGIAVIYLQLGAQFAGFTQLMVYIGAVAILAVFAIMMTHRPESNAAEAYSPHRLAGSLIAAAVFTTLAWAIHTSPLAAQLPPPEPVASVEQIGDALMHRFVLPLEIMGILLTAALIGAVVIAMEDDKAQEENPR
jgi:NADH-quinone oxidoreductase subunit J